MALQKVCAVPRICLYMSALGCLLMLTGSSALLAEELTAQPCVAKPLPPLDCWRCGGPGVCPPCNGKHAEFLYYGTYPWDDDPVNGFNDCPGGRCGYVGAALSRAWIRWREHWASKGHRQEPPPCQVYGHSSGCEH